MLRENLALLALGANLSCWAGPPEAAVRVALGRLGAEGLGLRAVSRFWRTPAHPAGSGPDYVNAAAVVAATAAAVGTPAAAITSLEKALDPSSCAAAADGPRCATWSILCLCRQIAFTRSTWIS